MKRSFIGIVVASLCITVVAYWSGGLPMVIKGLNISKNTTIQSFPLILTGFIVLGQLQVLLTGDILNRWLQKNTGLKGMVLSSIAGGAFPGGPYIFFPFLTALKDKGIPFYLLFSFINGKIVYDFTRIPLEAGFINPWIALLRNTIALPVPIAMGWLARIYPVDRLLGLTGGKKSAFNNHIL